MIQSRIEPRRNSEQVAAWDSSDWPESGFKEIFNVAASRFQVPSDRKIIIEFENGLGIHLVGCSDKYECVHIGIEDENAVWII